MNLPERPLLPARTVRAIFAGIICMGAYPAAAPLGKRYGLLLYELLPQRIYFHVDPFFYPEKRYALIAYAITLVTIAAYTIATLVHSRTPRAPVTLSAAMMQWLLAAAASAWVWWAVGNPASVLWVIVAFLPWWLPPARHALLDRVVAQSGRFLGLGVLLVGLVLTTLLLLPLVLATPRVGAEMLDLPTTTLVQGTSVDTLAAFNHTPGLGLRIYDSRQPGTTPPGPRLAVAMTPALERLLVGQCAVPELHIERDPVMRTMLEHLSRQIYPIPCLRYDDTSGSLIAVGVIDDALADELHACVPPEQAAALESFISASRTTYLAVDCHRFSTQDRALLSANEFGFGNAILDRYIFHHHNFVLADIQKVALGCPLRKTNLQYGELPVLVFSAILSRCHALTFEAYLHLSNAFFLIYLISGAWFSWCILRDVRLTGIFVLANLCVIGAVGHDTLVRAPGMNPIRHLFDLAAFALLSRVLVSPNRVQLLLLIGLPLIAILNNKQTGLFLDGAIVVALITQAVTGDHGRRQAWIAALLLVVLGIMLESSQPGEDTLSRYYIAGLDGFATPMLPLLAGFLVLAVAIVCLIGLWPRMPQAQRALLMGATTYSALMFLYFIWGGTPYHFLNFAGIYVLNLLIVVRILFDLTKRPQGKEAWAAVLATVMALCLGLALVACRLYGRDDVNLEREFATHRVYAWNFPKAHVLSVMDPAPLEEAVALIDACPTGPGIHLISEYDDLLPFLADRYSAMPFLDLKWFLTGSAEARRCLEELRRDRPRFLFIDTALLRADVPNEIIDRSTPFLGYLHEESLLRNQRRNVMRELVRAIMVDYHITHQGGLLCVCERNDAAAPGAAAGTTRSGADHCAPPVPLGRAPWQMEPPSPTRRSPLLADAEASGRRPPDLLPQRPCCCAVEASVIARR